MPGDYSNRYIVEQIFPVNEVHLIYGPSGAGKTTMVMQIMDDWSSGREVYGHKSFPRPFCYISCTRSDRETEDHMERLRLDPLRFPHFALIDIERKEDRNFRHVADVAIKRVANCGVLFIDAFTSLCPGKINDNANVREFMLDVKSYCQKMSVTIIGTALTTKNRDGEGYSVVRDRLPGAADISSYTGTKALIDFARPRDVKDTHRTLSLMPQRCAGSRWDFRFSEDGGLVESAAHSVHDELDEELTKQVAGTLIETKQFVILGEVYKISERSVYRWLEDQIELGTLRKSDKRGLYIVPERYIV